MSKPPEIRTIETNDMSIEERAEGEKRYFNGEAMTYDSWSTGLPFQEKFLRGAFKESLERNDEVFAFVNHNRDNVLGRTSSGTLEVLDSDDVLRYKGIIPKTTYGDDFAENIRNKNIKGTSIAFSVNPGGEQWSEVDGVIYRVVSSARLSQVSPEVTPAYNDTSVAMRSMEEFRNSQEPEEKEDLSISSNSRKRKLELINRAGKARKTKETNNE